MPRAQTPPAQQQRISRVLLHRHFNGLNLGEQHERMTQADFVELYFDTLLEELRTENIMVEELPEMTAAKAAAYEIPEHSLVLVCSAGWTERPLRDGLGNITQTMHEMPNSRQLAEEIGIAVGDWGHCYAFGHRTAKPRKIEAGGLFARPETKVVAVEPVLINGPDLGCYLRRMRELGEVIGRCVAHHLQVRGQAETHRPLSIL